jgi:hypothetical protein
VDTVPSKKIAVVKLYIGGGRYNAMEGLFKAAHLQLVTTTGFDIRLMTLDHSMIKNIWEKSRETSEEDLARWLLDSDAHYIVCHPHQQTKLNWEARTLYRVFKKVLGVHPGFPFNEQFDCSIYTQDKFKYIEPLGGICNRTLKIECIEWLHLSHNAQIDMLSR